MSYIKSSTDNPLGFRPWFSRLGDLSSGGRRSQNALRLVQVAGANARPVNRRRGLGDDSTDPDPEQTKASALNLVDQFRSAKQRMDNLENQMRANPAVAQAIGRSLVQERQNYADQLARFTLVYSFFFPDSPLPDGLQAVPVIGLAAAAAIIAAVAAALYLLHQHLSAMETQAASALQASQNQGTMLNQAASLNQQANDALARGDVATARALAAQAASLNQAAVTPAPATAAAATDFLSQHWLALTLVGLGVLVVPKLMDRFL